MPDNNNQDGYCCQDCPACQKYSEDYENQDNQASQANQAFASPNNAPPSQQEEDGITDGQHPPPLRPWTHGQTLPPPKEFERDRALDDIAHLMGLTFMRVMWPKIEGTSIADRIVETWFEEGPGWGEYFSPFETRAALALRECGCTYRETGLLLKRGASSVRESLKRSTSQPPWPSDVEYMEGEGTRPA